MAGIKWNRVAPGHYTSSNVSQGVFEIRRENTTRGINRAGNPMWHVYYDGTQIYRQTTLADAKRKAEFYATRRL